jgi:hypothetical protein
VSKKTNDGADSPLRPVDPVGGPEDEAGEPDWMAALGVDSAAGEAQPPPKPAPPRAPEEAEPDQPWMDQLVGAEPAQVSDEVTPPPFGDDSAAVEPGAGSPSRRRRDWAIPAAMTCLLVVLVCGGGLLVVNKLSDGMDAPPDLSADLAEIEGRSGDLATEDTGTTQGAAFQCEGSASGETVTGDGAGDTRSVAGVVLAFQHAYYSERDAKKALSLTSDDSPLVNVEALQEGIDSVPEGTEHCVSITADGAKALVKITEARPSEAPETFVQQVTTSRDGDRVEIVSIAAEED